MVFCGSATYTYLEEESLCPLSTGFQVVEFRGAFSLKSPALPGAVFNLSFFFFFSSVVVVLVGAEPLPGLMLNHQCSEAAAVCVYSGETALNLLLEVPDEMVNAGSSVFLFISLD